MMTVKQWLKQAYRLQEHVRSLQSELKRLRSTVGNISSPGCNTDRSVPSWSGENGDQRKVYKMVGLEEQILDEIRSAESTWKSIHDAIEGLENTDQRLLMRHRYLEWMTFDEICHEMNIDERNSFRIHKLALENIKAPEGVAAVSKCQ